MQGGKARLVHVNEQVRDFIRSAQRVAETPPSYASVENDLEPLLLTLSKEMTPGEQKKADVAFAGEGITGLLQRLDIRDQ
nr:negative regulator [Raoultella sp. NCTC 9187]